MDVENNSPESTKAETSFQQSQVRAVDPVTGEIIPNVNTYQQKKNLAQGMMDLALVSANANQLRLVIQIAVGVGLIMNSRYDVNDKREICKANKINDLVTIGIFLITLVNVLISAFGVAPQVN
ncbi:ninjurin-A-like isoform X2 [Armigeres subalbatus]|uniref:ninjurin-A-like isoform X2 n=1 Tax=Armigeres subalbatus TaxID=124917 RepID=UPI002ED6363E